ncbi:AfsR/SARP family transcriptional regulator, partial [Streptomyces sp. WAC06614]|uniref:AfsR/SARP family transcriptional regulator n=1 Tax=Streptomyces sp. WAC06614 TaxID=2487416 RepID=UPI0021AF60D4
MRLLLLGPSELRCKDGGPVAIGGARRRAVLAALALNLNRVVPVERLLDLVWDEAPPPTARAALHGHIASLRTRLDGTMRLVTQAPGYTLMAERSRVDVHHMQDLVAAARDAPDDEGIRLLGSALDLWRGPALEDCESESLRGGAGTRLAETRLRALELLGERLLRIGQGAQAVPRLAEAVEENPLRESLVRLLMLCHRQEGRQAEALALYDATRRKLKADLGVSPGQQLQAVFTGLLDRMSSADAAPAGRPAPRPSLRTAARASAAAPRPAPRTTAPAPQPTLRTAAPAPQRAPRTTASAPHPTARATASAPAPASASASASGPAPQPAASAHAPAPAAPAARQEQTPEPVPTPEPIAASTPPQEPTHEPAPAPGSAPGGRQGRRVPG